MHVFLLSLALSVDGFFVGLSLGFKKIKIPFQGKAIIGAMSVLFAYAAVSCGELLARLLPDHIAKIMGAAIMGLVGLWIIFGNFFRQSSFLENQKKSFSAFIKSKTNLPIKVLNNPPMSDMDQSGVIDLKEALLIGIALSLDILGTGFGIGAIGISPLTISPCVGLFLIIFLSAGMLTARFITKITPLSEQMFSYLTGIILIILSISRLF